jgi:hypothetical protein
VVGDNGAHDQAHFDAEAAKRMGSHLRTLFLFPASEAVPVAGIFWMFHDAPLEGAPPRAWAKGDLISARDYWDLGEFRRPVAGLSTTL